MSEYRLFKEIVARSVADNWEDAKLEWDIDRIDELDCEDGEEPDYKRCLCSHYSVKELRFLQNKHTGEEVIVGNVCVTKFMEQNPGRILAGYQRIVANLDAAMNTDLQAAE